MSNQIDPLQAANEVKPQNMHYFGQIILDGWNCASPIQKGVGKVPYDPAVHSGFLTVINLTLAPTANSKATYSIEREYVTQWRPWQGLILPSIQAAGHTPSTINRLFVHVEMAENGSYVDKKTGETKKKTEPKVLAVYTTEADCEAAAASFFGKPQEEEQAFDHRAPATNGDLHPAAANEPNLATVQAFVNILAPQASDETDLKDRLNKAGLRWESDNVQAALEAYRATKQVA